MSNRILSRECGLTLRRELILVRRFALARMLVRALALAFALVMVFSVPMPGFAASAAAKAASATSSAAAAAVKAPTAVSTTSAAASVASAPAASAAAQAASAAQAAQVAAASVAQAASAAGSPISVYLDGRPLTFDVPPQIINNRTMVPLRAVFEAMGATVEWDDGTQSVTGSKGGTVVVLTIGNTSPAINGKKVAIDQPAVIVNNRTLAPLRFVAEAFGGNVQWDDDSQTASITTGGKSGGETGSGNAGGTGGANTGGTGMPFANGNFGMGQWHAQLTPEYSAVLVFKDENRCLFEIYKSGSQPSINVGYEGDYKFVAAGGGGRGNAGGSGGGGTPDTLVFTLFKHWYSTGLETLNDGLPYEINGTYAIDKDNSDTGILNLKLVKGDSLFSFGKDSPTSYKFKFEQRSEQPVSDAMAQYLTGVWEYFQPGRLGCRIEFYNNEFNGDLGFLMSFTDPEDGLKWQYEGHVTSKSWQKSGGGAAGDGAAGGAGDDSGEIELFYHGKAIGPERYLFWGSGNKRNMVIHKGKLMMGLIPDDETERMGSIFDEMDLDRNAGIYMFAKETGDKKQGERLKSVHLLTLFWEWDRAKNLIWLDNREFPAEQSNTVAYTAAYPVSKDAYLQGIESVCPGEVVYVGINASGEITSFSVDWAG